MVQSLSQVWFFETPWTAARQDSLTFTISQNLLKNSCPLSWWCYLTISSSVNHFSSSFILSQHQGLFKWVCSLHQVAKVLELQHRSLLNMLIILTLFFFYVCSIFYKFLFYTINIVDLQCCAGFRCIAKSFRYMYIFIHVYPFFFRFFSNIGYDRILNRVPCGIQSKPEMCFSPIFPGFQSTTTTHLVLIQMPLPPGNLPIPLYLTFHPGPVNLTTLFLFYTWFVYETVLLTTYLLSSIRIQIP